MKTAAFYSYKGGVGRSLFVANLSLFLARFAAKKVLTVDLDLEAPGLHYKYKTTGVIAVFPTASSIPEERAHAARRFARRDPPRSLGRGQRPVLA